MYLLSLKHDLLLVETAKYCINYVFLLDRVADDQLTKQVDDTLMAVGSEAMTGSLTVYDYIKTVSKKTPGLKTVAEQLGERFKAIKGRPTKAASGS